MPTSTDSTALMIAMASGASWLISLIFAVIKGRDWIERTALAALKSESGRKAVMAMNKDHLDVKLDTITDRISALGTTINSMSNKLERRLDKLDADMQAMHVRVTLLEQRGPMRDRDTQGD